MRVTRFVHLMLLAVISFALPAAAKSSAKLTDAQIFAVLNAANTGEVDAGNLAQSKTTNDQVKSFAGDMIKDHSSMNDDGTALASKLGVTPADNPTSDKLKKSSEKEMAKLRGLDGAAFDKAYVQSQVADHELVLSLIDKKLLPAARNPDLKSLLQKARPTIAEHLKHAKQLQSALKKSKATMGRNP